MKDLRAASDDLIRHVVRIPARQMRSGHPNRDTNVDKGYTVGWFDNNDCCVCQTIVTQQALNVSVESLNDHKLLYHFLVPRFESFQGIMHRLEIQDINVRIKEVSPCNVTNTILTPKQEHALLIANDLGFFQYPRSITMFNLAQKVGIASSTLSEILRRGTRRLVEHYVRGL